MKLIKVKGIVIKEVTYKESDKIITILTDEIGKISCIARGSKKTNSPILASSQYLVYSEFVLYKNNNFYYVNSASIINMFYNLRIDLDKLECIFELTKLLQIVADENQDTSEILRLFLNTIYILEKDFSKKRKIIAIFKIKVFVILGFCPRVENCNICSKNLANIGQVFYDYVSNTFVCPECCANKDKRRYIELSSPTLVAIKYVMASDLKKVFNFDLKSLDDFYLFGQVYADAMVNGI